MQRYLVLVQMETNTNKVDFRSSWKCMTSRLPHMKSTWWPFEQTEDKVLNQIPNMSFLQRKKLAQLAGEEYNLHIRTRIKPKFGSSSPNLFVRILLKINEAGEIVYHEIKESSGSKAFDKTAELAVRNAVLDPLPKALAENPPYIVVLKLRQN